MPSGSFAARLADTASGQCANSERDCEALGVPEEKLVATVGEHGHTPAASVPLALDVALRDGRISNGQHVLLQGVGGGFTWGSVLLRWQS